MGPTDSFKLPADETTIKLLFRSSFNVSRAMTEKKFAKLNILYVRSLLLCLLNLSLFFIFSFSSLSSWLLRLTRSPFSVKNRRFDGKRATKTTSTGTHREAYDGF